MSAHSRPCPIELVDERPRCFSDHQWTVWRAAEIDAREFEPAGFCVACTPGYATVMRMTGQCRYPRTLFRVTGAGDDSNDIAGERHTDDQIPAVTPCDRESAVRLRDELAEMIESVRLAPESSIREQLGVARGPGGESMI